MDGESLQELARVGETEGAPPKVESLELDGFDGMERSKVEDIGKGVQEEWPYLDFLGVRQREGVVRAKLQGLKVGDCPKEVEKGL